MSEEVDYWSATIKAYEPLQLPTPEFSVKLLKRPPFRFIYDVVAAIDQRFQAYQHLFTEEQRDSASVDTKEKKIEYLQVLIHFITKVMNVELDVNPKKIVSGHDPEKTNMFLQYIAAGVGYGQQDAAKQKKKQKKQRSSSPSEAKKSKKKANREAEKEPTTPATKAEVVPPPFADPSAAGLTLPSRDSLPRKSGCCTIAAAKLQSAALAKEAAQKFNVKVERYGLNLGTGNDSSRSVKTDGESIVQMWNALQNVPTETTPTQMPIEALETAIQRQMDMLKQFHELLAENDHVIDNLEALVT